ncbi:HalOD1 output domain-containing protein [Halomicroarcula sp. GCM10025817]|uniref:HalOD1 output domain-containing protein n=1 Tax=Haloarcula TaxID=2237 RepID=UPI0023E8A7C0|nr:HalOD1 output domain-containing protein [Halomicroarcula sp. SYNS111]
MSVFTARRDAEEPLQRPAADEAQTEVTFSYYGYRITVTQDGSITMRKLGSPPDDVD